MAGGAFDIAIVGGGLAGGLIALALAEQRPELDVVLIEEGQRFGGNHIWSYFEGDVAPEHRWLVAPLVVHGWKSYEVRFPAHSRIIDSHYYSIESEQLDHRLRDKLPPDCLISGKKALAVGRTAVVLEDGRRIKANGVIDARGPAQSSRIQCGWQKFCGQLLEIDGLHGLDRPVIMDATVEQFDGYRFVYLLPFGFNRVFVEDTYYSNKRGIARDTLRRRIADYADEKGWRDVRVLREEFGTLPVLTGGDFNAFWRAGGKKIPKAGARAMLFHPVTSYSFPDAVRTAMFVAGLKDLSSEELHYALFNRAQDHWRNGQFYRTIDRMMFEAAEPDERYRILERFYRLPAALIERFYAGKTSTLDKMRILAGKPPVPISKAIAVMKEPKT